MRGNRAIPILIVVAGLLAASCGGDSAETATSTSTPPSTTTSTSLAPSTTTPPSSPATGDNVGPACRYTNPFSGDDECRLYVGDGWDDASRAEDCAAPFSSVEGTLVSDGCGLEEVVGTCRIGAGEPEETLTFYYGGDTGMLSQFCANPGGGVWADPG